MLVPKASPDQNFILHLNLIAFKECTGATDDTIGIMWNQC